ncbi:MULTISPECIES: ATP-binding protein [Microvirgula]|uniref:histidine kinase n=1 Tax=Microvirgula aerodenitrificans TaxID=57480 RepID=A0A2U3TH22_9NEIS|nr:MULTISPECIES: ATP-binding protein [Microvirgula]AVY92697.1 histidine kinase [Microvirgula aerodenitrificans]RAS17436.1 phospho-acceptor domain-containing protein [Microvirgula sp. AG722]
MGPLKKNLPRDRPERPRLGEALRTLPTRYWLLAGAVWLVMELVTGIGWYKLEHQRLQRKFVQDTEELYLQLSQRFDRNEGVLNGLSALFGTFDRLSFEQVRRFSAAMLRLNPHLYTIELLRRVDGKERARFEADMSAEIGRPFHIRDFAGKRPAPLRDAPPRDLYYPITLIEPDIIAARPIIGLDAYHDSALRDSITAALTSGVMVPSQGFTQIEGGRSYAFSKIIETHGIPHYSSSGSDSLLMLLVNTERLLATLGLDRNQDHIALWHHQLPKSHPGALLYDNGRLAPPGPMISLFTLKYSRNLSSRHQPFELTVSRTITPVQLNMLPFALLTLTNLTAVFLGVLFLLQRAEHRRVARQATAELFKSRERASVTLQAINDGVITFGIDRRIEYVNPMASALSGVIEAEAVGRLVDDVVRLRYDFAQAIPANPFTLSLSTGHAIDLADNSLMIKANGEELLLEGNVSPLFDPAGNVTGAVFAFRNMGPVRLRARAALEESQRRLREHETHLAHVARLHTMGEMASGIAHEINQPLTAIVNYNQAALRLLADEEPEFDTIRHAIRATANQAQRAGEIIKRLRAFVSRQSTQRATLDLNRLISDVLALADFDLRSAAVTIDTDLTEPLPLVEADSIQMEQVVLNLLRNALDAIKPIEPWGRIFIRTRASAKHVQLEVGDNGTGLNTETLESLFHPFFTTKSSGMGLGLTICQSIVESFEGSIRASNRSAGGALFTIEIPVASRPSADSSPNAQSSLPYST